MNSYGNHTAAAARREQANNLSLTKSQCILLKGVNFTGCVIRLSADTTSYLPSSECSEICLEGCYIDAAMAADCFVPSNRILFLRL